MTKKNKINHGLEKILTSEGPMKTLCLESIYKILDADENLEQKEISIPATFLKQLIYMNLTCIEMEKNDETKNVLSIALINVDKKLTL